MFGFSFGELVVLIVVAIVVIGPKDLPKVLRKLGMWAGKLRRMASDLRAQSGIDDVLRAEGLTEDLAEIRKLARGELDTVSRAASFTGGGAVLGAVAGATATAPRPDRSLAAYEDENALSINREREHPKDGPDTCQAMPDTAFVYAEGFPRSKWAADPVWRLGDPNGVVEPEPAPPSPVAAASPASPSDATPEASPSDASRTASETRSGAPSGAASSAPTPEPSASKVADAPSVPEPT